MLSTTRTYSLQLSFLQQQVDLINMLKEYGLDPSEILQGLQLGLDADIEGIIDAMTRAVQAIIDAAEDELGVESPSTVFEDIGHQVTKGLARGIFDGMGELASTAGEGLSDYSQSYSYYTMHVSSRAETSRVMRNFQLMKQMGAR